MNGADLTDRIAVEQERNGYAGLDRDDAIKAIRTALKRRTGKAWSVTGGRGTAWGWVTVHAPPARRTAEYVKVGDGNGRDVYELRDMGERLPYGQMTPADLTLLRVTLGFDADECYPVGADGWSIPAGTDYRIEAVARAEGRNPSTYGVPYWD
jgi:hypothetical protein